MANLTRYDDLNTKTIGYLTFMSVLLLIVIILLLQALCYNWIDWQEESKLLKQGYPSSDAAIAKQRESLSAYGEVDEVIMEQPAAGKDGTVDPNAKPVEKKIHRSLIPISEAEKLLLGELKTVPAAPTPKT
ncbi:MAG: hypothetical protein U0892_07400 [Pirellulales bacterium]